jgi:hypothetical protein
VPRVDRAGDDVAAVVDGAQAVHVAGRFSALVSQSPYGRDESREGEYH